MIKENSILHKAPKFVKLLGPSFILLGLGLGSGEIILWPFLVTRYGLGIIWAALLGITLQFFINMEIERYTLATGESVFVGFSKKYGRVSPFFFIFSTLIPWIWPGIIAASAQLISYPLNIHEFKYVAIAFLLVVGLIYTFGSFIYKTQETVNKWIIFIGVPFIFVLSLYLSSLDSFKALGLGLIGKGEGYLFFPLGISFASFLSAVVFAGAGGNLNLAQSYYIKEKGYGMGKYFGKISSLFKKDSNYNLEGKLFIPNSTNFTNFYDWWKKINLEHLVVFWFTGLVAILALAHLAYQTVFGNLSVDVTGTLFLISEASIIGAKTLPFISTFFLIFIALMLFGTQFAVLGSTSRIISENVILAKKSNDTAKASLYFFVALWTQIASAIIILLLGFTEPLRLVTISAVLNSFSMFFYATLIVRLNKTKLHKEIAPNTFRVTICYLASAIYAIFALISILQVLK